MWENRNCHVFEDSTGLKKNSLYFRVILRAFGVCGGNRNREIKYFEALFPAEGALE